MLVPYEAYQALDEQAQEELAELENYDRKNLLLDINDQVSELSKSVLSEKHGSGPYYEQYEELQNLIALCLVMNKVLEKGERGRNCEKITNY